MGIMLPQHTLSRLVGWISAKKIPGLQRFLQFFVRHYGVNMAEAQSPYLTDYLTFNAFFTRKLVAHVRPIPNDSNAIVSPVDGTVSQCGRLLQDRILQVKKQYYSLRRLLAGDDALSNLLLNGAFLTAYLAPGNYHRIHIPFSGRLRKMTFIPGRLFSVSPRSVECITDLFARNERVICEFDTDIGTMVVIAVGAMLVGSMVMNWHGVVKASKITSWKYERNNAPCFEKGDELGYFKMGSTVIVLFPENTIEWSEDLKENSTLMMGKKIGIIEKKS